MSNFYVTPETRRRTALELALAHLPKGANASRVLEMADNFKQYLYDGTIPEVPTAQ